jgi:uncharacterized protein (DUF2147 family)
MNMRIVCFTTLALGVGMAASLESAHADPKGLWIGGDGGRMRVAACGPALCATLVSLVPAKDPETGRPWTDKFNPDPSKRNRPLVGTRVLIGMQPNGPGKWSGTLYHSEQGKTYAGNLIELGPKNIRVEGCAIGICGGETMTRLR